MDSDLHSLDVLIKHDEALFGNIRYNSIGLVEQVENINNQINMINNASAPDVYARPEANEIFDTKADKTDTYSKTETDTLLNDKADKTDTYTKTETDTLLDDKADKTDTYTKTETDTLLNDKADKTDTYTKTETDTLLDAKADKTELIDSYSKTEDDALLLLKANVVDIVDSYSKTEDDALLLQKADKTDTYSKIEIDTLLDAKADKTDTYTKTETNTLLDDKADKSEQIDSYSKTEDDALLLQKADKSDTYTKTETNTLLDDKADKTELIDSYSKTKDDALLLLKAIVADLTNYVDLNSVRILYAYKQFQSLISVFSILKQGKNDASILLAGGGDMLVSSLVTQPQLQEVRDIATGKSKAYVFSTQEEWNDWMAVQDNVAKLVIGDNLYIVDKEVTDYWWDGTDLKVLETELLDMNNVVTTLGTATGGDNAITDISIDGNVLTPAKNKNFVDTDYDQSISGQKTFNTTIHSVGIMVQSYDNSSVVCAGGGIRSIADIQSAQHSKSEDDALLLLKADKSTTYTKTEDDALLLLKADKSTTYTKTEDDALLLLKADKTQLIDSYTKGETNNLLNKNADTGVSYTKGEDDALLLLKADKTQLIDSYTKGETNNLLNNKADIGVSYTKGEDDALLLLKADKTQLIDSYTKGETNNLLNNKADTGVSYTKGEDDALLLLKADKSTTYTKTETDYIVSQIDAGDVDLTDYYNKTKTDELLGDKADAAELSNYMTLGTSQTINANKTFNNACRFVSSIDGMSTVTGSSFVKSGADNTVVLLGAGGTKSISEFTTTINDSNYVRKDGDVQDIQGIIRKTTLDQPYPEPTDDDYVTLGAVKNKFVSSIYSGSINGNLTASQFIKSGGTDQQVLLANGTTQAISEFGSGSVDDSNYVKKSGQKLQIIHGVLRRDDEEISISEYDEDYITKGEVANQYVSSQGGNQTIYGTKTFNSNVSATGFAKKGKDDTSVLLAGGGDMLLSAFGGLELVNINYTSNVVSPTSIMSLKCYRYGSLINFYGYIYMGNGAGASDAAVAVCSLESAGFPKYLFYADDIVFAGSAPHVANFRFGTDGKVTISIKALSGTAGLAGAASAYINVTYPAAN
ncbi:MAG: hypothetical protein EZS28_010902 [Streblomastix strix]|uniref:Uncharacterized protein n=1 Tax=Streblomastix strix TaxID=222440 RepID=A0A5J4WF48_9EUKA|nr:MAG: hypothetical protein EZS28_010902 [Streblomastix strix]